MHATTRPAACSQDADADLLEVWASQEARLFGIAYRMLGSVADSQDVLQDAFLRLRSVAPGELRRPGAWLATVVTRLCLNRIDATRTRREVYVGPWLPEPVAVGPDPAETALLAESISAAFLVVLETLSPAERAAFVLHDVFGHPFAEVAETLGRDEAACRQLATRARRAIRSRRPRFTTDPDQRREVSQRFIDACTGGDVDALVAVLAPDVTLTNDGGGEARAARRVVSGADRVARFLTGVLAKRTEWTPVLAQINGAPGLTWHDHQGAPTAALSVTVDDDGRIATVALVVNPGKLRHLTLSGRGGTPAGSWKPYPSSAPEA